MTEEERWIADAQMGDHDAFRQLWEAHHAVVMAVALRLCQHRALAEEIIQGAFVLAWQRLARFQQGCPFRPWLLTLAYRHALDVMEQQQHHLRMISLESWVHQGVTRGGVNLPVS